MAIISRTTRTNYETMLAARRAVDTYETSDVEFQRFLGTTWGKFAAFASRRNMETAQGFMVLSLLITFPMLVWLCLVFAQPEFNLWTYLIETNPLTSVFFWALPILAYSIYYPTLIAARGDYEEEHAAPARKLAHYQGMSHTATRMFASSLRDDIENAGYQIVTGDDTHYTYVTAKGVIALMFDENNEMFLALNGSPIRDGYSSLLEAYDSLGEVGTTITGDTVDLSKPVVWKGSDRADTN